MLPHMQIARHGFAAAFVGNQLHVVGGSFQSDGMPRVNGATTPMKCSIWASETVGRP